MKKILILSFSDLARDPRVNRQIKLLNDHYHVSTLGFAEPQISGVEFLQAGATSKTFFGKMQAVCMLKLGMFESYYWSVNSVKNIYKLLNGREFDLIISNDLNTLPLALRLANGKAKVVFDAHEYAPREFEDVFSWRFLFKRYSEAMCRKYIPQVAGMMTVCPGIADEYQKHFGVRPAVVINAPVYHDLQPSEVLDGAIRMIHHGGAAPSRKLELMIETMRLLDGRFQLDFMLMPSPLGYLDKLKQLAKGVRGVRFISPVPMRELPIFLNQYDIGLYLLPPNSFNNAHALPNKLFEFIQARLGIVIGPSPEMASLVSKYDCGVIAKEFTPEALAQELNLLTSEKVAYYKQRANVAAQDLCFEQNAKIILGVIEQALAA